MPFEYKFTSPEKDFVCEMLSAQCSADNQSGARCKRVSVIGYEYCWSHLITEQRLRIKKSNVPGAGKGLFAFDRKAGPRAVVFKEGDVVTYYHGETLTSNELTVRYGAYTAQYALEKSKNRTIDAACHRSVGSMANAPVAKKDANAEFVLKRRGLAIVATRDVRNESEIFVSYGDIYDFNDGGVSRVRSVRKRSSGDKKKPVR